MKRFIIWGDKAESQLILVENEIAKKYGVNYGGPFEVLVGIDDNHASGMIMRLDIYHHGHWRLD